MKSFLFIALLGITLLTTSCEKISGVGPIRSEIRNHKNYDGLRVSVCGQLNFQLSQTYSVEILAQDNILDELESRVSDGDLVFKWSHPLRIRNCEDITINVKGPDLKRILNSGATDIAVRGEVDEKNLDITLSGSGIVDMQDVLIENEITIHLSGSGGTYIKNGKADETKLFVSGSGEIDLGKVVTNEAESHISGSGSITVNVKNYLEAFISGSGDVYYFGNPEVNSKVSGSGRVKKR